MDRTRSIARPFIHRLAFAPLVALGMASLSGCDWPSESERRPDYRDRLGLVGSVSAPDSAASGTAFDVTILTNGSNGCWQKGHDDVTRPDPLLVQITPYDREYIGDGACTLHMPLFQHVVPITTTEPGRLVIEVRTRLHTASGKDSVGTIETIVTIY